MPILQPTQPSSNPPQNSGRGLQRLIARIQALWDDVGGTWCDKDYILSLIAINSEDVESKLESLDLSFDTNVIVLPSVPAGTTDLTAYQSEGEPLENMMLPVALEWRLVGQDDSKWSTVARVDKVMDAGTTAFQGVASWEWRGGIVHITPSGVDVDLRIRDEELPAILDNDSTTYVKGLTNVLAFGVAALIGYTRGGAGSKLAMKWEQMEDDALSVVIDRMVKNEQVIPRRMGGRRSTSNGPKWRIPLGN